MKVSFTVDIKNIVEIMEAQGFLSTLIKETPHSVTETAQKSTKAVKPKAEVAQKVETPSEATETKSSITLETLKDSAKNAVEKSSREEVKKTINEFAQKIVEVKEEDYGKLYKKLQSLGK